MLKDVVLIYTMHEDLVEQIQFWHVSLIFILLFQYCTFSKG